MRRRERVLYILCDLEGASGISSANWDALKHGSGLWRSQGRGFITSDVQAVCDAAEEFGIRRIVIDDEHDGGKREPNLLVRELPTNVRVLRRPHLPGKARKVVGPRPFGLIFVGQHAMEGGGGFAPHTIAPHIGELTLNGLRVGEIGLELCAFMRAPLLAVVGEEAAVAEARALCPNTVGIPIKSLERNWFPSPDETRPLIRRGVLDALRMRDNATGLDLRPPFRFTLRPAAGYALNPGEAVPLWARGLVWLFFFRLCRGRVSQTEASWQTRKFVRGVWALHCVRGFLRKT